MSSAFAPCQHSQEVPPRALKRVHVGRIPVPAALQCRTASRITCQASKSKGINRPEVRARYQHGPATELCSGAECLAEEDGAVLVRDDLDLLLQVLPSDVRQQLINHANRNNLLEVVLDLGRRPEARFVNEPGGTFLRGHEVSHADLAAAEAAVGEFGTDNRAGVTGTLHRVSCLRNRKGSIVGLTCRVGRAVTGHSDMVHDLVAGGHSLLLLGAPGVGKTTVVRELARVLSDDLRKRVVIVDTSNEIGGDGDCPHPAIGSARRMQVLDAAQQHHTMIEAVENHTPQVVIVDEIGTKEEAQACRTIAERGVVLIGTAHGILLENLIRNPTLSDLVGGIQSVTLGDEEAKSRGTQKSILERKAAPTFPVVVELRSRGLYVVHWVQGSVDALLQGKQPTVQVRERDGLSRSVTVREMAYNQTQPSTSDGPAKSSYDDDYDSALRKASLSTGGPSTTADNDSSMVHEGMELLRFVAARRSGILSGAKQQPVAVGAVAGSKAGRKRR